MGVVLNEIHTVPNVGLMWGQVALASTWPHHGQEHTRTAISQRSLSVSRSVLGDLGWRPLGSAREQPSAGCFQPTLTPSRLTGCRLPHDYMRRRQLVLTF